jgi:eukaryotic-like serine/threonine-protein kinase
MADDPAEPDTSRYEIEREIHRSSVSVVYVARDTKYDREVVLKVLNRDLAEAIDRKRFEREIRLLGALQHPHIIPLFDSGDLDGSPFYVAPFINGESLRERLARGTLDLRDALTITFDVAGALDYAHARNVVHRDVKPGNILLSRGRAIVSDFGVARVINRVVGERTTEKGYSVGTPAYISPEQARAAPTIDGRSDTYSLACVLFEMLTGAPPFVATSTRVMITRRLREKAPRLESVRPGSPRQIDDAIAKALSIDPDERFATAGDFARALGGRPSGSLEAEAGTPERGFWRRMYDRVTGASD